MDEDSGVYRQLQEHMDKMPIGFPATESGIELDLLKQLFSLRRDRLQAASVE